MRLVLFNRQITSVHGAALIIGAAGFLSRILGLLRDRLLASRFGAGDVLDAYYAAFQIPDVLFTIFLIGAASAAILPVFIEWRERDLDTNALIQTLLTVFGVVGFCIVLVLILAAPLIMPLIIPGFSAEKMSLSIRLTQIMLVSPLFLGLAGIVSSVLQANRRFLVYAIPPIFYNIAIIFGILVLEPFLGPEGLAVGVTLGAILQVAVQLPFFFALGFRPAFSFRITDPGIIKIFSVSIPRVAAISFNQVTHTILIAIASFLAVGSVAIFKFATNLVFFPIGVFGVSYALAVFPKLSESAARKNGGEFLSEIFLGIRSIIFWSLPIAFLFIVLRAHIVRVILGTGLFDWNDTRLVAATVGVLSLMIIFEGLNTLLLRGFYALEKTWQPLAANITASFITVVSAVGVLALFSLSPEVLGFLSEFLRVGDLNGTQILAIALAFTLGSVLNFLLLFSKLRKVAASTFGTKATETLNPFFKMIFASVAAGTAAYSALLPFPALLATNTFIGISAQGVTGGLVGFGVYFAVLYLLKSEELLSLLASLRERLYVGGKRSEVLDIEKFNHHETPR